MRNLHRVQAEGYSCASVGLFVVYQNYSNSSHFNETFGRDWTSYNSALYWPSLYGSTQCPGAGLNCLGVFYLLDRPGTCAS